jgi:hypothetical protein
MATPESSTLSRITAWLRRTIWPRGLSEAEVRQRLGYEVRDFDEPPAPFTPEWVAALPPEGREAYAEWQRRPEPMEDYGDDEPMTPWSDPDLIRDRNREGK